jgi:hypothetical protein
MFSGLVDKLSYGLPYIKSRDALPFSVTTLSQPAPRSLTLLEKPPVVQLLKIVFQYFMQHEN